MRVTRNLDTQVNPVAHVLRHLDVPQVRKTAGFPKVNIKGCFRDSKAQQLGREQMG